MHGLNEDRYDNEYDYSDEDLETLADRLQSAANRSDAVYCLFNNYEMYDDARERSKSLARKR